MATLLLVEDNAWIRRLMVEFLSSDDHEVVEAQSAEEALTLARNHQGEIQLLVTDLTLGELGGRELAERVMALRPRVKVLFVSGYARQQAIDEGHLECRAPFLQKPFGPEELAQKVAEILKG